MPSYMKSTLSQMAMLSLVWILVFAWYSVVTGKSIDLPDWIVATISSIITLYVKNRVDTAGKAEPVEVKPNTDDLAFIKSSAHDTTNQ